jgi:hypothetical protein
VERYGVFLKGFEELEDSVECARWICASFDPCNSAEGHEGVEPHSGWDLSLFLCL